MQALAVGWRDTTFLLQMLTSMTSSPSLGRWSLKMSKAGWLVFLVLLLLAQKLLTCTGLATGQSAESCRCASTRTPEFHWSGWQQKQNTIRQKSTTWCIISSPNGWPTAAQWHVQSNELETWQGHLCWVELTQIRCLSPVTKIECPSWIIPKTDKLRGTDSGQGCFRVRQFLLL